MVGLPRKAVDERYVIGERCGGQRAIRVRCACRVLNVVFSVGFGRLAVQQSRSFPPIRHRRARVVVYHVSS